MKQGTAKLPCGNGRWSSPPARPEKLDRLAPETSLGSPLEGPALATGVFLTALFIFILLGLLVQPLQENSKSKEISLIAQAARLGPGLEGAWSPQRIVVKKGEPVTFRVTALDAPHYFIIPELGIRTPRIAPGQTRTVTVVPEREGTFLFYCTHHGMFGELVVR